MLYQAATVLPPGAIFFMGLFADVFEDFDYY